MNFCEKAAAIAWIHQLMDLFDHKEGSKGGV